MTTAVYSFSVGLLLAHYAWAQDSGLIGVPTQPVQPVQTAPPVNVDQTLARGAGGCKVIEAVLAKLTVSSIFPEDNGFLRRIAYVETLAGRQNSGDGGPWAVTADMLRSTQTAQQALIALLKEKLLNSTLLKSPSGGAIDWSAVTTQDLSRPMYSALAARFYLQLQLSATSQAEIPVRLDEQAKFWAALYGNGTRSLNRTETLFLERIRQLDDECACKASVDMAFVMDMSGSVGSTNFRSARNFVVRIVESFSIGPNNTRVGLITYSTTFHVQFDLDDYSNKNDTVKAIEQTAYKGGNTNTGKAIRAMIKDIFNQSADAPTTQSRSTTVTMSTALPTATSPQAGNGDGLPDVGIGLPGRTTQGTSPPTTAAPTQSLRPVQLKSRVGIVVTDGRSQDEVLPPSLRAQNLGITMFAIGVGSGYVLSELKEIASEPDRAHVFTVGDYSAIDNIRANLRRRSCQASAPISIGQPVSGTVGENETTYAAVPIDSDEEVTITLEAVEGAVTLFTSLTVPNPSEALHDQKLSVSAGQRGSILISPSEDSPLAGGNSKRRRRQAQPTSSDKSPRKLYISIQGEASTNTFILQSQLGNHMPTPSPTVRVASGSCTLTTKLSHYGTLLVFVIVIFAVIS